MHISAFSSKGVENHLKTNVKFLYMVTTLFILVVVVVGIEKTTSSEEYPELIIQNGICGIFENIEGFPLSGSPDENKLPVRFPWVSVVHLRSETTTDDVFPAIIVGPSLVLMSPVYFRNKSSKDLMFQPLSSYTVAAGITDTTTLDFNTYPAQSSKISHIRIHPGYNYEDWQNVENDLVLLHLKTPFKFNNFVRPICIPMNQETIDLLSLSPPSNNNSLLLTGWKKNGGSIISLKLIIQEPRICKKLWNEKDDIRPALYKQRICGFVDSANSHINCIFRDNAAVRRLNGSYYFVALVNNFYSDNKNCTSKALYFFSILSTDNLKWMDNNLRCGPNNYSCTNGECVSIDSICNKKPECTDSSDEDPDHCRSFNPCFDKFACGTYGKCIPFSKVCDLVQDCDQGEDEEEGVCPIKELDDQNLIIGLSGGGVLVLLLIFGSISFFLWKKLERAKEQLRNLTPEEVKVFLSPTENDGCDDSPGQNIPYDKKYEILSENLKILWAKKLGSGAFGAVFKGELKKPGKGEPAEEVAVKTFMSEGNITHLKSLLMELKVQIFVGEHENILRLIGAYTEKIQTRILYIVLEFCPFGCLQDYLRNNCNVLGSPTYVQHIEQPVKADENSIYVNPKYVSLKHLAQWSYQIAKGMEFLSSRNVTHGDLATRNVLLNRELIAKISDFGLARKLYESGVYCKKTKEPLPWQWMAPESLRLSIFSTQSDVWSFGITLWEIFSCGSIPYGGMRFTTDFVDLLDEGMRLNKPANASIEIYKVMTDCWNATSTSRPYFQELVNLFDIQVQLQEAH